MKRPSMQLYTGDWLKDPALGQCSPATRGIWFDLLCLMHENEERGELTGSYASLARIARCTKEEMQAAIAELKRTNTAHVTVTCHADVTDCPSDVTVRNRRMSRQHAERVSARKRKRNQRARKDDAEDKQPEVTNKSRLYSSSSSSTSVNTPLCPPYENGADVTPKQRAKSAPSKRGTRWGEGDKVPGAWRQWAVESSPLSAAEVDHEAEKFADYWRAIPGAKGLKLDWQATWRNWIRNNRKTRGGPPNGTRPFNPIADAIRRADEAAAAEEAAAGDYPTVATDGGDLWPGSLAGPRADDDPGQ